MRSEDEALHPKAAERETAKRKEKSAALLRFVGAIVLGLIGSWKLVAPDLIDSMAAPDGTTTWMWVGVLCLAFGLASIDQVAKFLPGK